MTHRCGISILTKLMSRKHALSHGDVHAESNTSIMFHIKYSNCSQIIHTHIYIKHEYHVSMHVRMNKGDTKIGRENEKRATLVECQNRETKIIVIHKR